MGAGRGEGEKDSGNGTIQLIMAHKDFYKTLGVEKKATPDQIKKAYRKLAVRYHPDKNKNEKGAEAKFKEVNEANSVLSDPEKRKRYDAFGEHWEHPQYNEPTPEKQREHFYARQQTGRQGNPFTFKASSFEDDERYEDIFSQFFARQQADTMARNGENMEAEMQATLEEAFTGTSRIFVLGKEQHRLTLKKGVRNGQQLRLRSKGQPGKNGGKPGDLLINIRIATHPRYTRTGNDLRCQQSVDLLTAVLGGKTSVQTLHGEKMMNLQAGTQYGATMRMRNLGMPDYEQPAVFGDLYVEVLVRIPSQLSEEERELYGKLAALK